MGATCTFPNHAQTLGMDTDISLHWQLIAERDRLNKDLEMAHSAIKQLEAELDNLQVGYGRGSSRR